MHPLAENKIEPNAASTDVVEITIDRWQSFARDCHGLNAFHTRFWLELLSDFYRLPVRILGIERSGEVLAAIPFVGTPTFTGKQRFSSLPFSDCVPILSRESGARDELLTRISAGKLFENAKSVIVRAHELPPNCRVAKTLLRHVVDTSRSLEDVASAMDRRIRQNVRRAGASHLRFDVSTSESCVQNFYRLQAATRRKLGVPVQPIGFFQLLHEKIVVNGLGRWGLVLNGSETVAAGLLLDHGETMICKYCASDPSQLHLRPNDLFFAEAIGVAARGDHKFFDFGTSREQDTGLRRFKRRFGALETNVHYLLLKGEPSASVGDSGISAVLGILIKRSPIAVSKILGSLFYRYSQ